MKRYMLFGFDQYYPSGGLNDLIDVFDTVDEIDMEDHLVDFGGYQLLDLTTSKRCGFNLRLKIEEYEDEHGDINDKDYEKVRRELIFDFIKDNIK